METIRIFVVEDFSRPCNSVVELFVVDEVSIEDFVGKSKIKICQLWKALKNTFTSFKNVLLKPWVLKYSPLMGSVFRVSKVFIVILIILLTQVGSCQDLSGFLYIYEFLWGENVKYFCF